MVYTKGYSLYLQTLQLAKNNSKNKYTKIVDYPCREGQHSIPEEHEKAWHIPIESG